MYRRMNHFMSKYSKAKVFAVDYRLAPQHPFPCALIDAVSGYLHLLETHDPEKIVFMGDSCRRQFGFSYSIVINGNEIAITSWSLWFITLG